MARTLQLEVRSERVSFELDRFGSADERLEVTGRWFGVRGRRFVRPTLTLFTDQGAFRALADLEHKPWEPAEGGRWEAAFPWDSDAEVLEAELAVAPDVTIALPAPGITSSGSRARAKGRRGTPSAVGKQRQAPDGPSRSARRNELEAVREQLASSRREIERLRNEIAALREEAAAERSSSREGASALEDARRDAADARAQRESALADLERAHASREDAVAQLREADDARDAALAARDAALAARDEALAARDKALGIEEHERRLREQALRDVDLAGRASSDAAAQRDQLQLTLDQVLAERDQLQQALGQAARERDDAISARGAALVMRNATRAAMGPDHHAGWVQRTAAVIVLVCAVFALLIVLHLL
jgi:hypothetical protein